MRFRRSRAALRIALLAALFAAPAGAQPVLVDPDPDSDVDWGLRLESVVSGLSSPSALVLFGPRIDEEFLVIEKDTGLVRHFEQRVEQAVALDLAVDNCGERGLVGIALHPAFDPTPTPVTDPPTVRDQRQDWVYLSYFTDAGRTTDGCDADAVLRVERYVWNGTTLVLDPLAAPDPDTGAEPFVPFQQAVDATTAVSGAIATNIELTSGLAFEGRLYVVIGSLGRDGRLQNNAGATELDDTSVVLRLDENGEAPGDNPFDVDPDVTEPQDRYFAYGVRSPRGLVADPYASLSDPSLWLTERSDSLPEPRPDEIARVRFGTNGGYRDYQGRVTTLPKNTDPLYPLVDLAFDADDKAVSTYLNPPFSFEDQAIDPTGLGFAGREAGNLHIGSLFVGAADGRLFRFAVNSARAGFILADDLGDTVAAADDDLTQILVGEDFGAISDVQTGVDGSLYVLGRDSGAVHHLFSDARRDLAISRVKVPKRITLSAAKPVVTKRIRFTLENRGESVERILSRDDMNDLLGLQIVGLPPAGCAAPTATLVDPWYVRDPYPYQLGIKPRGKLSLSFDVAWECPGVDPLAQDVFDFETSFQLDPAVLGVIDEDPTNDVCPRPPSGTDKGCGSKGGGPLQTDLILK